jgi:hypothetical protein
MRALGALFLLAPLSIAGSALAPPAELTCADFQHNPDSSWSPLKAMTITAPNGQIQAGPGPPANASCPVAHPFKPLGSQSSSVGWPSRRSTN